MLDVTELKLSEILADNEKFRIDDGFFSKLAVFAQRRIESLPHVLFGDATSVFRKGIFDIKASKYVDHGVPFVRVGDLKDGLIDTAEIVHIPIEIHEIESRTALWYGDIILSKTAYAAASFLNIKECNASQDTIAIRLSLRGKEKLKSGFIVAFLNSKYGLSLMERQFQGNVQTHLSLPDAKKIPIPLFSCEFQSRIHASFEEAHRQLQLAADNFITSENVLLQAFGLENWKPPEPLTYARHASEVFSAGRLDPEYFSPRVSELISYLSRDNLKIGDIAYSRKERFDPHCEGEFSYIEISDVMSNGIANNERIPCADAPSRATWYVHDGDVITSMVRPKRRLSAQIAEDQDSFICSSGFVVLKPISISSELLLTYLKLPLVCELMDLHTSASMYPAISEQDLLDIPIPLIESAYEDAIVQHIRKARSARHDAQILLDRAKRAVEIAIEQSEAAALEYLNETGNE